MRSFPRTAIGLIAAWIAASAQAGDVDDPLLRPIAPGFAAKWLQPQVPVRIFGNVYLVGFSGLNVGLIRTEQGLILIDGAVPQAVKAIEDNIRSLGFKLSDVKLILSTEPHYDHAGGIAALARDTGATVVASASAAPVLMRGQSGPEDPQMAWLESFPAVKKVRIVRDGEAIRLGKTVVTARATPGHTPGSMSWALYSCDKDRCAHIVFASGLNPIAAGDYRFSDPARKNALAAFRRTFASLRTLPCDIVISAHPDQAGGDVKLARFLDAPSPNPFIDPGSCRAYADKFEPLLDARLAKEKGEPAQ